MTNKPGFLLIILALSVMACSVPLQVVIWVTSTTTPMPATKPPLTATLCPSTSNRMTLVVTAENLEIRSGPGTNFENVGYLKLGDCVDVIGNLDPATPKCSSGWLWIKQGYVCAEFLK